MCITESFSHTSGLICASTLRLFWMLLLVGLFSPMTGGCSAETIANGSDSLIVYSGRSESLVGPIIEQFQNTTGVEVSVNYGKTSEMAATILEEGGNSPADVFFAQDPGGLGAIGDMLSPLPDNLLKLVPNWASSPQNKWVGISGRARVVAYNTSALSKEDLPTSLNDLTDSRWKGRIGWAPTNGSFQTMVTAMRVLWGERKTKEWLQGIEANDPQEYPSNTPIVAAVGAGEIDVGFVNHYYLYRFIEEEGDEFEARNYFLRDAGPGSLVMVASAGILDTAKNRDNGERFLRFMLSKVAQQYFADQTFEYPLVDGVTAHHSLPELADLGNPNIDMTSLSDLRGTQQLLREIGIIP